MLANCGPFVLLDDGPNGRRCCRRAEEGNPNGEGVYGVRVESLLARYHCNRHVSDWIDSHTPLGAIQADSSDETDVCTFVVWEMCEGRECPQCGVGRRTCGEDDEVNFDGGHHPDCVFNCMAF